MTVKCLSHYRYDENFFKLIKTEKRFTLNNLNLHELNLIWFISHHQNTNRALAFGPPYPHSGSWWTDHVIKLWQREESLWPLYQKLNSFPQVLHPFCLNPLTNICPCVTQIRRYAGSTKHGAIDLWLCFFPWVDAVEKGEAMGFSLLTAPVYYLFTGGRMAGTQARSRISLY